MPRRRERTPGPGAYDANDRPVKATPPAYSIGAKRSGAGYTENPGPGTYTPRRSHFASSPAFSMSGRHPGPTQEKARNPGPGAYDTGSRITLKAEPAYSLSSRTPRHQTSASPGPGQYTVPPVDHGPAFSMSIRTVPPGSADKLPGPGAYSARDVQSPRSPAYSMGGKRYKSGDDMSSPGPGAYTPRTPCAAPAFTMPGRLERKGPGHGVPGPGQYEADKSAKVTQRRFPAYTLTGRKEVINRESRPGPGTYSPRTRIALESPPAFSMANRTLGCRAMKDTPGPGAYSPETRSGSPAYSIASRKKREYLEKGPGPGAYTPRYDWGQPAFSMARRRYVGTGKHTPGPADYNPDVCMKQVLRHAPAFSMGMRKLRGSGSIGQSPGPGSYRLWRPDRGPAFSMGSAERFDKY